MMMGSDGLCSFLPPLHCSLPVAEQEPRNADSCCDARTQTDPPSVSSLTEPWLPTIPGDGAYTSRMPAILLYCVTPIKPNKLVLFVVSLLAVVATTYVGVLGLVFGWGGVDGWPSTWPSTVIPNSVLRFLPGLLP